MAEDLSRRSVSGLTAQPPALLRAIELILGSGSADVDRAAAAALLAGALTPTAAVEAANLISGDLISQTRIGRDIVLTIADRRFVRIVGSGCEWYDLTTGGPATAPPVPFEGVSYNLAVRMERDRERQERAGSGVQV